MITRGGCMITNGGPTIPKRKSRTFPANAAVQGIDHKKKTFQTLMHHLFISRSDKIMTTLESHQGRKLVLATLRQNKNTRMTIGNIGSYKKHWKFTKNSVRGCLRSNCSTLLLIQSIIVKVRWPISPIF